MLRLDTRIYTRRARLKPPSKNEQKNIALNRENGGPRYPSHSIFTQHEILQHEILLFSFYFPSPFPPLPRICIDLSPFPFLTHPHPNMCSFDNFFAAWHPFLLKKYWRKLPRTFKQKRVHMSVIYPRRSILLVHLFFPDGYDFVI